MFQTRLIKKVDVPTYLADLAAREAARQVTWHSERTGLQTIAEAVVGKIRAQGARNSHVEFRKLFEASKEK